MTKTIQGTYTSAKIFISNEQAIEPYALAQLQMLCNLESLKDCNIRVMPDVHPGKTGTIGLTMTVGDKILPNLLGIDIGCGITLAKISAKNAEFQKLDHVIRKYVPSGNAIRQKPHHDGEAFDFARLYCAENIRLEKAMLSLGSLGGGNHFIELDKSEDGALYIAVHSGSRHTGKEMTEHYLRMGQRYLKKKHLQIPYELTWLEDSLKKQYIHDVQILQEFAALNRKIILTEITKHMKWKVLELTSCTHNYLDVSGPEIILRKGAISAKKEEPVIIPVNMRDGILVGTGLGNNDWNCSAPHGSGRIFKRTDVGSHFTLSAYKKEMKGVYSTCISKDTLAEAPFAYRSINDILETIPDTAVINQILKPVFSFKAGNK